MSKEVLDKIKSFGYQREYYRFDIIVPKKMFKRMPIKEEDIFCQDWSVGEVWDNPDNKFPIRYVSGINIVNINKETVRLGVLLDIDKLTRFVIEFDHIMRELEYDYEVVEAVFDW